MAAATGCVAYFYSYTFNRWQQQLQYALSRNDEESCKSIQDPQKNPERHQNLIDLLLATLHPCRKFNHMAPPLQKI